MVSEVVYGKMAESMKAIINSTRKMAMERTLIQTVANILASGLTTCNTAMGLLLTPKEPSRKKANGNKANLNSRSQQKMAKKKT